MTWMDSDNSPWRAPTQDEVARRFAEAQAERLRFCHDARAWFVWDGVAWRRDRVGVVTHRIRELARTASTDPGDCQSVTAGSPRFVAGIERFARGDPELAVTAEAFDGDPLGLGTPTGSVDLRTGKSLAPDPADGFTLTTRVAPAEAADCPLWRIVLDEAFGEDTATIGFVQRLFGSALSGDASERAIVVCLGAGRVILDTVAHVMGDYAATSSLATLTGLDGRHGTERARLRHARLVVASDGDTPQAGQRLERLVADASIGRGPVGPGCTLLVAGTAPPRLAEQRLRERVRVLPFVPMSPDHSLAAGLRDEGPAILRWMIEGCLAWRAEGLVPPPAVAAATRDYRDTQDAVGQFLAERCVIDSARTTTAAALFAAWSAWAEAAGEDVGSRRAFSDAMSARGLRRDRTDAARLYVGIGLTPDAS